MIVQNQLHHQLQILTGSHTFFEAVSAYLALFLFGSLGNMLTWNLVSNSYAEMNIMRNQIKNEYYFLCFYIMMILYTKSNSFFLRINLI